MCCSKSKLAHVVVKSKLFRLHCQVALRILRLSAIVLMACVGFLIDHGLYLLQSGDLFIFVLPSFSFAVALCVGYSGRSVWICLA